MDRIRHALRRAFTLPVVLVAMTGLLILLGGLMTIVTLERQTARAHLDLYRADLAARSALAEVRTILSENADKDSYAVIRAMVQVAHDDDGNGTITSEEDVERPYLFLAEGEVEEGSLQFEYAPLFSAEEEPDETGWLELPDDAGLPEDDEDRVSLRAIPWEEAPVVAWRYLEDESGRKMARYAFWLEDTEAYLDPSVAGNAAGDGSHARTAELWPERWPEDAPLPYPANESYLAPWNAPGLGPGADPFGGGMPLGQIALYTLAGKGLQVDETDFDDRVRAVQDHAETRDSLLAAMEIPAPLQRDEEGHLLHEEGRRIEENLAARNRHYEEQPLIPAVRGIDPSMIGEPKLNLNEAVQTGGLAAVGDIASHIRAAFPDFDSRRGGLPSGYVETLAANMIDYADVDGESTQEEDGFRGIDSYPLVSEWLLRYRWSWESEPYVELGVVEEAGRKYVLLTVAAYAELWNMTSQPVQGQVELEYETRMSLSLAANPEVRLMDEEILNRAVEEINPRASESGSQHELEKHEDGRWYFPPLEIEMEPNEYVVKKVGEVRYKLDAGLSIIWIASPLTLGNDHGQSSYHMRWNGKLVDRSLGRLERPDVTLNYPSDTRSRPRQKVRGTIPGHSYGEYGVFSNGMGDPRIAFHADEMQSLSAYPRNYSGWRRNVRLAIFRGNPSAIYGRVIPSEWPDRGHDSDFGSERYYTEDQRVHPDDPRFEESKPVTEPRKAPQRISNLGRYYSETELGHLFDPIMWGSKKDPVSGANLPRLAVEAWTKEVTGESFPSVAMGGGNTLRIGRPEHARLDEPGWRASGLLDLFHAGDPFYNEESSWVAPTVVRRGHVNINTAPRDVLRSLAAGMLVQDPVLARELSARPTQALKAPATTPLDLGPPSTSEVENAADLVAGAIMLNRPYTSPSQLALVKDRNGRLLFGNDRFYPAGARLQWSDAAAEESFARVYNSSTVRSRNFRVHVIGQAVQEVGEGVYKILSTRRKVFRVFADPGEREGDGELVPENMKIEVLYENNS